MEKITSLIKQTLGENLVLVGTYGKVEQYFLIVVKTLSYEDLEKVKGISDKIVKTFKKHPLLLTATEVSGGTDVFPLEFLHIQATLEVLHGDNIFKDLKLEKRHVRRELEFEFRSKLINLREAVLATRNKKELKMIVKKSLATLVPIFNGLLYLKGKEVPSDVSSLFQGLQELYHVDFMALTRPDVEVRDIMKLLENVGNVLDDMQV